MSGMFNSMSTSASAMAAQSARLRIVSENIANADTPGYRRKIVPFEQVFDGQTGTRRVATGQLFLDRSELRNIHDPSHPMADERGYYLGSNVSTIIEIADAREAQRSYEANLRMFDQSRKMATSLLDLLRR
jgi:flagellar basal-body rod protein FlgC